MGSTLFLESAFWGTNRITNLWSRQQNQFQGLAAVVWSKRVKDISKNLQLPSLPVFFSPDYIFLAQIGVCHNRSTFFLSHQNVTKLALNTLEWYCSREQVTQLSNLGNNMQLNATWSVT